MYSHAETCVIGQHELIVHNFNRLVNVVGYDPSNGTMTPKCQTVSAVLAYDYTLTGEVFIIDMHQAILIYHLHNNLLCPMQMSIYGVTVNYIPK